MRPAAIARWLLVAASSACAAGAAADGNVVPIGSVQGPGAASPLAGTTVTVAGVVSGDFQDYDELTAANLGGFYLASEAPDDDPASSEGLFVFEGRRKTVDVRVGDRVRVTGTVQEYYGETQLRARTVTVTGHGKTAHPASIALPAAGTVENGDGAPIADLERYEGMLVQTAMPLTVTGTYELERFGTLQLAAGGRLWQYTELALPDPAGYRAHRRANAARSILLDDGRRSVNALPITNRLTSTGTPTRVGDTVTGLVGNLRYARGSGAAGSEGWRLMPTVAPEIAATNPRPPPPSVPGELRVASLNVLNYFSRTATDGARCGPHASAPCRGADNAEEQVRQRAKIVATVAALDADIVGLVELENNDRQSLVDLVAALNERAGRPQWAYVPTGVVGGDAIKPGFLYRPERVRPEGTPRVLDASIDPRFDTSRSRPALAQRFAVTANGSTLTVVLNHFKSKGSPCDDIGDPNRDDGQGNCNRTRARAAAALVDWLTDDEADVLLIGDFNAYAREDPVRVIEAAGYVNLGAADPHGYSYVYDGQSGTLDHAFASPHLAPQITGFVEWHSNADEAPLNDYNLDHGRDPALFEASPYRASDHDPLLIGVRLAAE